MDKSIRVRFAPSPTGLMHLGNVRTALMNYLFAQQKGGTLILRIEDTDPQRNFDPGAKQILADLAWLGIDYDEGPEKGGPHQPYFQSERTQLYQKHLDFLKSKELVYRCFCTSEELEKKRQRQLALKMPPRYDRNCFKLTQTEVKEKLNNGTPFIWRMLIDKEKTIAINDLARGAVTFDLQHFSDFPLTREDGSFTFTFANFVDDLLMQMSHVFRGEDHLSNTANQAVLFQAFDQPLPTYWHMPMLFNAEGKKLSKRDFGFSLQDLKNAGFLPEALCNYLAIIGGGSFEQEIMSSDELIKAIHFDSIHATGQIKYDLEKLRWINHKWIDRYDPDKLVEYCTPFLYAAYPQANEIDKKKLSGLIQAIKTDLVTLTDITKALQFYFEKPDPVRCANELKSDHLKTVTEIVEKHLNMIGNSEEFVNASKKAAVENKIPLKQLFSFLRVALTGKPNGPSIHVLIDILGTQKAQERITQLLHHVVD